MRTETLDTIIASLEEFVGAFAPAELTGEQAVAALDQFERVARLAEAGRLAVLARVEQTRVWQGRGHPSAAHWAAERTGTTIGRAVDALSTARALATLPATRSALSTGAISPQQTHEIALAAKDDPASERRLLNAASMKTTSELRNECRMVRAAAAGDEAHERIHRTRFFRQRIDGDGALSINVRTTPDAGAPLLTYLHADADRRARLARRDGTIEPFEAHLADALCALPSKLNAEAPTGKRRAKDRAVRAVVYVHADVTAWDRGHAVPGDRCEITGVGPTSIAAARRMASQPGGMLKLAIHNDGNLTGMVNLGRYVPAQVDDALTARDQKCIVKGCTRSRRLERDHRVAYADGGETSIGNLGRLCSYHHYLKTHLGYRLVGEPPNCRMVAPDEVRPEPPPQGRCVEPAEDRGRNC